MVLSCRIILFGIVCGCLTSDWVQAALTERSISVSRQFLVYGPDARLRGVVCDLAESTKKDLLGLLRQHDQWKLPVVIGAQLAQANLPDAQPAMLTLSQTEGGLKLQLDLAIGTDVDPRAIQREIVRALLLEIAYRDGPPVAPGTVSAQIPDWLLEGMAARVSASDTSQAIAPLVQLAAADKIAPLAEVLTQRSSLLDSSSRVVYRAYSLALVEMLTSTPDRAASLITWIKGLPVMAGDPADSLIAHFPMFSADKGGVNAVWKAGLERLLSAEKTRLLSIDETETALGPLLVIAVAKPPASPSTYRLDEFANFIREPNAPAALQHASQQLLLLGTRANPISRPIVAEYQTIASQLARRKTKGIAARFEHLRTMRAALTRMTRGIDDYMNWFEATQAHGPSGLFVEYMKAAERAADPRPPRRDAISIYLSSLEGQLQN